MTYKKPPTTAEAFRLGVFGAALPQIIQLKQWADSPDPIPGGSIIRWVAYVAVLGVFMWAAGKFTKAWEPESNMKAIWVGASFPKLIGAVVGGALSFTK
jgi:hypothetical protein